jgi:hypothetical protein
VRISYHPVELSKLQEVEDNWLRDKHVAEKAIVQPELVCEIVNEIVIAVPEIRLTRRASDLDDSANVVPIVGEQEYHQRRVLLDDLPIELWRETPMRKWKRGSDDALNREAAAAERFRKRDQQSKRLQIQKVHP